MDIADIIGLFNQYGAVIGTVVGVLLFFLWKDWRREMRLQDRVDALEKEQNTVLLDVVERCTTVIAQNTEVLKRLEKLMERQIQSGLQNDRELLDRLFDDAAEHRQE